MDLHGIVSPLISAVNPMVTAEWYQSTGYTIGDDGSRTPTYSAAQDIEVQMQGMREEELKHANELNLEGILRLVFTHAMLQGVDRNSEKGGDLISVASGSNAGTWLVVHVREQWPDWTSAYVQKQVTT